MNGTIKMLSRAWGFLHGDREKFDRFFHRNYLARGVEFRSLREGQRVAFSPQDSSNGPTASDVRPLGDAHAEP